MESDRRYTKCYKFISQDLHDILLVASLVSEADYFRERYWRLLPLLHTRVPEGLLSTLLQFYDPLYHCFTFSGYQLVPTLEEFSFCMGVPVSDTIPFSGLEEPIIKHKIAEAFRMRLGDIPIITKGNIEGLSAEFLQDQAFRFANYGCIDGYHSHLALLIYGIVLFPNIENFVDMNAIKIFLNGNPVPTLLGDALHSIHFRTLKGGGRINCCVPLLYKWYNTHLPNHSLFRDNPNKLSWSQRIMSLRSEDISWFYPGADSKGIIDGCEEFLNVPLLGRYGGINYHPALARRQAALGMKTKPENIYLKNVYFLHEENELWRVRITHGWIHIHRKERNVLGKRDCTTYEPYNTWVCERACKIKMSYPLEAPMSLTQPVSSILEQKREELQAALEKAQKIGRTWKNHYECLELQLSEIIYDYDNKLARKDEIIKLKEEELKRKNALLKLHEKKRKKEDTVLSEGAWKEVIDKLVAKQTCLRTKILLLQERLVEEEGAYPKQLTD